MRLPAFEDLSKEQDEIYNLPLDGTYLVSGPPGTGKSVMALYRAQALRNAKRTPRVLMYNQMLSQYTTQASSSLGIGGSVSTFHKWIEQFWRSNYGSSPPTRAGDRWSHDWEEIAEIFLANPVSRETLPDLLVDEGQDLAVGFFRMVRMMARNTTVFADENQRIGDDNTTLSEIATAIGAGEDARLVLRKNYRNSAQIAALAKEFYCGTATGIPTPPDRQGPLPTMRRTSNLDDFVDRLARYASARTHMSIGVACPTGPLRKALVRKLGERGVSSQAYISGDRDHKLVDFGRPGIVIAHLRSMKGLEFDALFVPELQKEKADVSSAATRMLYYVVMSRARDELHLSWSGTGPSPSLLDGLSERGLVELK